MAKGTKKSPAATKNDPAVPANVDNYELPKAVPMGAVQFVEPVQDPADGDDEGVKAPVAQDDEAAQAAQAADLGAALDAALTTDAMHGTIAYELNFCINKFKADGKADELKYRLGLLHADSEEKESIAAILAAL